MTNAVTPYMYSYLYSIRFKLQPSKRKFERENHISDDSGADSDDENKKQQKKKKKKKRAKKDDGETEDSVPDTENNHPGRFVLLKPSDESDAANEENAENEDDSGVEVLKEIPAKIKKKGKVGKIVEPPVENGEPKFGIDDLIVSKIFF